jgi:hypothetical protein
MIPFLSTVIFEPNNEFRTELYPQFISVAGQQLDTPSFIDLLKRIEAFPAQNAQAKGFCQFHSILGARDGPADR